jgi:hypothetical protein
MRAYIIEGSVLYQLFDRPGKYIIKKIVITLEPLENNKTLFHKLKTKGIIIFQHHDANIFTTHYKLGIMQRKFVERDFFFDQT